MPAHSRMHLPSAAPAHALLAAAHHLLTTTIPHPEGNAPKGKTPGDEAPQGKAPQDKAPQDEVPAAKAPEAKAPEYMAPQEKAAEDKASERVGIDVNVSNIERVHNNPNDDANVDVNKNQDENVEGGQQSKESGREMNASGSSDLSADVVPSNLTEQISIMKANENASSSEIVSATGKSKKEKKIKVKNKNDSKTKDKPLERRSTETNLISFASKISSMFGQKPSSESNLNKAKTIQDDEQKQTVSCIEGSISSINSSILPIEEVSFATDDVSDMKDVFEAINKLCDDMKTSSYSNQDAEYTDSSPSHSFSIADTSGYNTSCDNVTFDRVELSRDIAVSRKVETTSNVAILGQTDTELNYDNNEIFLQCSSARYSRVNDKTSDLPEDVIATYSEDNMSTERGDNPQAAVSEMAIETENRLSFEAQVSPPLEESAISDTEPANLQWEVASENYYTASSEVSLVSDTDLPERLKEIEDSVDFDVEIDVDKKDDVESGGCVIAGHVAAMRERFENLTRTNTPCHDLTRSVSPLDRRASPVGDNPGV